VRYAFSFELSTQSCLERLKLNGTQSKLFATMKQRPGYPLYQILTLDAFYVKQSFS
jgi:hypothetical protein